MGESILGIAAATLRQVAEAAGTPVYVYSADAIRRRFQQLDEALSDFPHRIYYSVKANSNLAVLRLLRDLGAGADIVSGGELRRALRAGFAPRDVIFSGVGKTDAELEAAVSADIGLINVESAEELRRVADLAEAMDTVAPVGIRTNPDVTTDTHPYTQTGERGMKFGIPLDETVAAAQWATEHRALSLRSIGMHIGSQITDPKHYREGADKLRHLIAELRRAGVPRLESIDVGGGLGIRYMDEQELYASEFADAIRPLARETGLAISVEPGRFLVGNAGYLLTRCVYRKRASSRQFIIVDAGMNDLLRPSLYGATHDIRVVGAERASTDGRFDVVGPICETGDFLGFDRELPETQRGSLLAVLGAGAYGFTMSSTYNSRPRPAEVLVDGERWAVVRERETADDLMRGERIAQDEETLWNKVREH